MKELALRISPFHHPSTGKKGRKTTENVQDRRRTCKSYSMSPSVSSLGFILSDFTFWCCIALAADVKSVR